MQLKGIPIAHLLKLSSEVQESEEFKSAISAFDAGRVVDTSPELKNPESIYPDLKRAVLIKALAWMVDYKIRELPFIERVEAETLISMMLENTMNLCSNFASTASQNLKDIYNPLNGLATYKVVLSYANRVFLLKDSAPWWFPKLNIPIIPEPTEKVDSDYSEGIWSGFNESWNITNVPLFEEGKIN